ncbi:MAG: helix-turn-helix domain-containing protein [Ruminococcus flavefaciens]|nr:helix-turn-helix domain-containing protein [Ruminococcus flavefaciens]
METKDILKELRKKHSLSMKEFCTQCDISFNTYQNYETGKRIPTAEILVKIADFYGVTTDYLLGRETPDPIQTLLSSVKVDSKKFVETYQELPDLYQAILVDAMKRLSEAGTAELSKKRHVERLGDTEDTLEQDKQAQTNDESCA